MQKCETIAFSWEICGAKTQQKNIEDLCKNNKRKNGIRKKEKKTLEIHIQIKILNLLQEFCRNTRKVEDPKEEQAINVGNMCKAIKTYPKPWEICVEQNSGKFVQSKKIGNMCKKKEATAKYMEICSKKKKRNV